MNKKKIVLISLLIVAIILILIYIYLFASEPLYLGVGHNPNILEATVYLENNSFFPMLISDVIVKNENNEHVNGDIFKIQLNDIKRLNVTRKQLNEPDLKDHIHIFEPFDSLYIKGKDENNSYSVLIENGNFHSITEVIIKARVFGILPYQYTTKILQLNEK